MREKNWWFELSPHYSYGCPLRLPVVRDDSPILYIDDLQDDSRKVIVLAWQLQYVSLFMPSGLYE